MKIVVAPDSFKNNMRSPEVAAIIRDAVLQELPTADVICLPMADGGEGTTEAMVSAAGGAYRSVVVHGPLGSSVHAQYGLLDPGRLAVMEMAAASGLELVPPGHANPRRATTRGTGDLLRAILDAGIRSVVVGIGGSATVDGGIGMAQALGYRFLDASGQPAGEGGQALSRIARIDAGGRDPRLDETRIRVACDVTNPLTGPRGAARVYGPQKGADPEMVENLEDGLCNLDRVLRAAGLRDRDAPGDGAAGGLGAGLRAFCRAEIASGAALVAESVGLADHLDNADLLVTGEGRTDAQTASGKLCAILAEMAHRRGVPCALLSGALAGSLDELLECFDYPISICVGETCLAEAIRNSRRDLSLAARVLARLLHRRST